MRAVELEFARKLSAARAAGIALLALGIVAGAALAYAYAELEAEFETWQTKWRDLQHARAKMETESVRKNTPEWEKLQAELKTANKVIGRLAIPWDALFAEMEALSGEEVVLLSIEPDTERKEVRLLAEGKNFAAMLDYLRRAQGSKLFRDAHILGHQIQQQDPQRPVRFTIGAEWVDLSAAELAVLKAAAAGDLPPDP